MNPHRAKMGFSLIEILVVLGIVTVLSAITVASLRAGHSQQVIEFAAARVQRSLESARALAMAEGRDVYFVVAWEDVQPAAAVHKAYALFRAGSPLELVQPWAMLPKEIYFAEDQDESHGDLWTLLDFEVQVGGGTNLMADAVTGTGRVWVVAKPDGRFYPGTSQTPEPAHFVLSRGTGLLTSSSAWYFQASTVLDAVRIRIRPRSGLTRQERILP